MVDKNSWKLQQSIFDIRIIDVYLTSTPCSTWVLDTGSVAIISDLKQKLRTERRLAKGEVMMCWKCFQDKITIARSLYFRD